MADIHANLVALEAVLSHIKRQGGVDELWCLGDVVGYGPQPHQCIELLKNYNHVAVAGNHDWAVVGKLPFNEMDPDAAISDQWTTEQLSIRDAAYLKDLPQVVERGDFTLVHGSPRRPIREYLTTLSSAVENFNYFESRYCLVGHSHLTLVFRHDGASANSFSHLSPDIKLALGDIRLIINPGSVGQPRDGDPRASYGIYDDEVGIIRLYRVEYDIEVTQALMVQMNLPLRLVARLSRGV